MADDQGPSTKGAAPLLPDKPQAAARSKWSPLLTGIGCGFAAILAWAYWPTLGGICTAWLSDPDYTHGFFVVPISLWLLWLRREQAPDAVLQIDWRGLSLLFLAGAIRCIAGRFYVLQLDAWSIPLWVGGIVWLLFGWSMFRWALPSIAFLWFATPLPGTIEIVLSTPLQQFAAKFSASMLRLIGQPALVEGTTILLDDHLLDVERACSGLRMFYGIFALAVACIALARPPRWKAVLVLFAAAPVAIIANVVRIVVTGLLMRHFSNEAARTFSHNLAGLVMIPMAVTMFLLFLLLLGHVVGRLRESGGVAWLIKWCVAGVVLIAGILLWGQRQEARALTTLLDTANRYESEKKWVETIQYLSRYIRAVPEDLDTFTHLARLYQTHAEGNDDRLRAVDLLHTAWKNQPQHEDLATSAIQIALQIQDFDDAIQLCDELKSKAKQPETLSQAKKLRAEALFNYLQSDKKRGDYTWNDVKKAFEEERLLPDYEVTHMVYLVDVYRNPATTSIKNDKREEAASALLDKIVAERPQDPMAWWGRFRYRSGSAQLAKAANVESDLNRAIELAEKQPKNPSSASVLATAALYKYGHGDATRASELLQRSIEFAPTASDAFLMLAELKNSGRTKEASDEAMAILRRGIAQTGNRDPRLGLRLASLLTEKGQVKEADSILVPIENALPRFTQSARGPVKLDAGLVRSQILMVTDGPHASIARLRDVLADPDVRLIEQQVPDRIAKGYAALGQLYSAVGLSDLALDAWRQAVRVQPANAELQIQAAALAQQSGDFDSADRDYRIFVQKQNGKASDGVRAALIEIEVKRQLQNSAPEWTRAQDMLKAAKSKPDNPTSTVNSPLQLLEAEIESSKGNRDEAERMVVELTKKSPKEPAAWRALAVMRFQQADVPGALKAAEQFAAVSPQLTDAAALKASILASTGRVDEAVKEMSAVVDKSAPKDMPKAALALSQLLIQVGKPADARAALEKAHEQNPKNLQIADALANSAFLAQDWKSLEKYETWLNTIEGSGGTLWRAYRAQRMLASSQSIDDKDFQEAIAQADFVVQMRPRWSKAHFLQGEIAYRMNNADSATASYERAWQFGGRGILLADRLIDLLTRLERYADAKRYAAQVREYLPASQSLFDRAVPYLAEGNESLQMVRTAQQWADARPNDPEAHLRLGRVLLLLSKSSSDDHKQQYVEQATKEFHRATELVPNAVQPWVAIVMFYSASQSTHQQALDALKEFSKQSKINDLERNFVLGQLYDTLGKSFQAQFCSSQAQFYFNQAATLIEANPKVPGGSKVLGRIARFYLTRVPALGELYAHRALAVDPANADAKLVLLFVLANRADAQSAHEGLRLLDESKAKDLVDPATEARFRAAFLSRRGGPDDATSAIELLRRSNSQSREDKLLLARMYQQAGQAAPALDLLQQLVRAPKPNAAELVEFLQFWQQNFVAKATGKTAVQFAGQAKDVYQLLGEIPGQLPERLRWQLREKKAHKPAAASTVEDCMPIVSQIFTSPAAKKLNDKEMKQLVQYVLIVLLQEERDDCATQLTVSPPSGQTPSDVAIMLCHAYVAVPPAKDSVAKRKQAIETLLAAHDKNADVLQAVGDCSFMSAEYENAANAYQQALRLQPNERMARNNLALAFIELQKTSEAREVLAVALKAKPDDADLLDTQAAIDIFDNHADQAIPVLEKLVAKNPESPVLRFHLAVAYDEMKDTNRARESFFAATALGVQQRVLSPRDKKILEDLKGRYMATQTTAANPSSTVTQARN